MEIKAFFDKQTSTVSYVVWDRGTHDGIVIDPVLNYDVASSTFSEDSVHILTQFCREHNLNVHFILETHAHADHISGAYFLKQKIADAKIAISSEITSVQEIFKKVYNLGGEFRTDGSQFDQLLFKGDVIQAGSMNIEVIATPGHTPACSSYKIGDTVFVGDVLFMPDSGVARCDFPGGSASGLYDSVVEKLYTLPDQTRVFTAHDYQPNGRELKFETTIGESKEKNIHLNTGVTKEDFVKIRNERDQSLLAPKLILPSIFINISAGKLPEPEDNGISYLKIPIRANKENG